ncbi:MAG: hypothetical protein U1E62_04270 [Alsobacter sp.]
MTFSFKPPHAVPRMKVQIYYLTSRECKSHKLTRGLAGSRHNIQVEWVDATSTEACLSTLGLAIQQDPTPSIIVFDCGDLGENAWLLFEKIKTQIGSRYIEYVFDAALDLIAKDILAEDINVTFIKEVGSFDHG